MHHHERERSYVNVIFSPRCGLPLCFSRLWRLCPTLPYVIYLWFVCLFFCSIPALIIIAVAFCYILSIILAVIPFPLLFFFFFSTCFVGLVFYTFFFLTLSVAFFILLCWTNFFRYFFLCYNTVVTSMFPIPITYPSFSLTLFIFFPFLILSLYSSFSIHPQLISPLHLFY